MSELVPVQRNLAGAERLSAPAAGRRPRDLARRLTLGFLAVTVPGTLILGTVTLNSIRSLVAANDQLREIGLSLDATRDLDITLAKVLVPVHEQLARGDSRGLTEFERAVTLAQQKVASCSVSDCHASRSETMVEMANLTKADFDQLAKRGRAILDPSAGERIPPAAQAEQEIRGLLTGLDDRLDGMTSTLVKRARELQKNAQQVSERASLLTVLLTSTIVVMAVVVAVVLAERIARPLADLVLGTRRVMAGDLRHHVEIRDEGEIGELASSFNAMVEELERTRHQIEEQNRTLEARVRERTEALRESGEALRKSEKLASLGLLASGVAHELNNPLTGILMNTNLALEELAPDDPHRDDLRRIVADATRCRNIVEDLRVFSRRSPLRTESGPVAPVISRAVGAVQRDADARGTRITTEIAEGLPPIVWDPDRILRVLINLLTNALQALDKGGSIAVSAQREGDRLCLSVVDTGPGIPPEARPRIFDPFFTTKSSGTGLGLSICHSIVEEHGGVILAKSRCKGEGGSDAASGTEIRIQLPFGVAKS